MPLKSFLSSIIVFLLSSLWFSDAQSRNSNADDSFRQPFNQSIQEANTFLQNKAPLEAIDAINRVSLGFADVCQSGELNELISTIAE
jgi:hypothetical protein